MERVRGILAVQAIAETMDGFMREATPGWRVHRLSRGRRHEWSVSAAARILGVRRAMLSDLVNGNASLLPEMALRVEKAFGLIMDLLLRMQAWHDATPMRARAGEIDVRRYQLA